MRTREQPGGDFLDFVLAVINAIGEISKQEAGDAIEREWKTRQLGHPRDFLDSVPGRELVAAYQAAYPGRTVMDVDVLRWLNTMREAHAMTRKQLEAPPASTPEER